jgi:peptidoglycan/LPS O-acetylase OafA/YrhL
MANRGAQHVPLAYMRQLDGLRAIAVLLVFVQHWVPPRTVLSLIPAGALGVHLFFVLSGFLITSILLRCRVAPSPELRRRQLLVFYTRRVLRIFPAYYALLLVLFLLDVRTIRGTIAWHASYLSNFYFARQGDWQGPVSHFWSLAAEEQFYLCVPWLILFLPTSLVPVVIGLLPVAGLVGRWCLLEFGFSVMSISVLPLSSCDTLGFGCFLAWRAWRGQPVRLGWLGVLAFAALLLLNLIALTGNGRPMALFAPTALAIFCGWLVWRAAHGFRGVLGALLASTPVVYLGQISYGLYLVHVFARPLYGWIMRILDLPTAFGFWWLRLPIFFAMTLAVAALSSRYFEKPLLELKRFLPYAG